MEVRITTQLLIETASRLSAFQDAGSSAIQINGLASDSQGVLIALPDNESLTDGNKLFVKLLTLMCLALISHSKGETLLLKDFDQYKDFVKYFAGQVPDDKVETRDRPITPSKLDSSELEDDEVVIERGE